MVMWPLILPHEKEKRFLGMTLVLKKAIGSWFPLPHVWE